MKKILFVYRSFSSFVKKDLEILKEQYKVIPLQTQRVLRSLPKLFWNIRNVDIVYVWFAGTHAFFSVLLAKLFRKKAVVVVGGYDATCIKEISYGAFCSWKGLLTKWVYKHVDKILAVDQSLLKEIKENTGLNLESKAIVLPTGYDYNFWKPSIKKNRLVLTVGAVNWLNIKRKGLDMFVEVAKHFPDIKFVLVGKFDEMDAVDYLRSMAPRNVIFAGFVSDDVLLSYYQRAKVYCQLSLHEGLPNALCEAMLCECVPVGTKVNGIPHAIGDTGILVDRKIDSIKEAIKKAMSMNGRRCRERIKRLFPLKKRRRRLIAILEELK